jgi:DNA primase
MVDDLERLKQRIPLLDYLRKQNWIGRPTGRASEVVGLCLLHPETRPSFYVNTRKNVFYCHGCGKGGDLIRFVELSRSLSFRQSVAYLDPQTPGEDPSRSVSTSLRQVA